MPGLCQPSSHDTLAVDLLDNVVQGERGIAQDVHIIDRPFVEVKRGDPLDARLIEVRQARPLNDFRLSIRLESLQIPVVGVSEAAVRV